MSIFDQAGAADIAAAYGAEPVSCLEAGGIAATLKQPPQSVPKGYPQERLVRAR
jgi:hypothetical protein